jgi:tRNA-splicing ligase RtcB
MEAIPINIEPDRIRKRAEKVLEAIEAFIPLGFESHESPIIKQMPLALQNEAKAVLESADALIPDVDDYIKTAAKQLGTLGGGNHFVEVTEDTNGQTWLMLHSGSRRIGKEIADAHIKKAMHLAHNSGLPDKALSVFLAGSHQMEAYLSDIFWAQQYAALNRRMMVERLIQAIGTLFPSVKPTGDLISCYHNYVAYEKHEGKMLYVTRKGAIRVDEKTFGIIPGAMARSSYIVKGKGNAEALFSAPHGAGRKLSRGQAKRKFTKDDIERQTEGTMCRKDRSILDELPGAYKDIDRVMRYSEDLVDVVTELKPAIVCAKAYTVADHRK